ncbi:MAG TPA: glycoside hydrolase family 13 protein, partial [Chloroflexota bacterium]
DSSGQPVTVQDFFGGDLQGVIDKLPYLKGLGVNTLWLTPIFLSPSNHKYDTSDYYTIDPHFGTMSTLQNLLSQAHADGIRIVLDGVFNHTGSDSIYFNRYGHFPDVGAYQSKSSPFYPWYTFLAWPTSYVDFSVGSTSYDTLPTLNENDAVKDFIFRTPDSVAQHWLAQGADGWRLDSAQFRSNTWWQQFRTALKAKYPEDILIAEDTGGPINATPFLLGNEFDGVMNYNFRDAITSFFANGNGSSGPTTATGFMNEMMSVVENYPLPALYSSMNLVDSHDTERILTDLQGNKTELKQIAAFQMTWLGAPTIYYGDEAGLLGGPDPDNRRTFPWDSQDTELESFYQKVIGIRTRNPALRDGSVSVLSEDNSNRVFAFVRKDASQSAAVAFNDGNSSRSLKLKIYGVTNGATMTDQMTSKTYTVSSGSVSITVGAHTAAILTSPVQG